MKHSFLNRILCAVLSAAMLSTAFGMALAQDDVPTPLDEESENTGITVADTQEDVPAPLNEAAENTGLTITGQGFTKGPAMAEEGWLEWLIQEPANTAQDVDFIPNADMMAAGETWFEYDYGTEVQVGSVSMVGWWPAQQGVKVVSFRYYDGQTWQDSDQNVTVPWGTTESGPVPIEIPLSAPVRCSRFRIVIHQTNTTWSSKCCMRSMMPVLAAEAKTELEQGVVQARELLDGAVVGGSPYQYSQAAFDALSDAVAAAMAVLDSDTASESDYAGALEALSEAVSTFQAAANQPGRLSQPEISLHGLTSSEDPLTLVNNTGGGEFNFYDGAMTMTDRYLEYDYINLVKIYSVDLLGWWPKNQGVRELSFSYYIDGVWHDGDQNVRVDWTTPAGSNGTSADNPNGEELTLVFTRPVECSRLRIYVTSAYSSWGTTKICMKRMEPRGEVLRDIKALYDTIRDGQKYVDSLLVGARPGEFPQAAVDGFQSVVSQAISILEQEEPTEEELNEAIASITQAMVALLQHQNGRVEGGVLPEVTLDGLEAGSGTPFCLADRQLATRLELTPVYGEESAILLDYSRPYTMSGLTLISDQPLASAVKRFTLQYWENGSWQEAETWTLAYRGSVPNFEGASVSLAQPVTASRFRLVLLEGYGDTYGINELLVDGRFPVDFSQLEQAVDRAQNVLRQTDEPESRTADRLSWALLSATNETFLESATQEEVDSLCDSLNAAADILAPVEPDPVIPIVPVIPVIPPSEDVTDPDAPLAGLPFLDVDKDAWYAQPVANIYAKGYMKGTGDAAFSPKMALNRGMMAQIIHNMAKNPSAVTNAPFTDLNGRYYAEAVAWGAASGVLKGYSEELFGGEDDVTREQMVVMLYRYAQSLDLCRDVDQSVLEGFADGAEVSGWAREAVAWAVENGLLQGRGNDNLDPRADITRAEVAAVLDRFVRLFLV